MSVIFVLLTVTSVMVDACPRVQLVFEPPGAAQITATCDPSNKYGIEDGIVVRRADGGFSMIGAEMYADPKWVMMRLGVWVSRDALNWTKVRTIRQSSGNFNGTDPHSSSWGPFFVLDQHSNTWGVSYVGYRGAPSNASGWLENFQGTIFARPAPFPGDAGLDSDFFDSTYRTTDQVLLAPDNFNVDGPWPHVCQGLQGTDSFYPFVLNDGTWAAFVGTSHQETPDPWSGGKWPVSLATAPTLYGPWTRYNRNGDPADAPCVDLNGGFSENPIVSRRPDNVSAFQAVIDWLGAENSGFGYACSADGLAWEKARLVTTPFGCRTPFGFVPMTSAEITAMTPSIVSYGIINASQIDAPSTSLQWAFYTRNDGAWEVFQTSIVQLTWGP